MSALALGAALVACSPAGSGGSDQASKTTFVVARTGDVDQLDPHKATAFQTVETLGIVYDQLVKVDDKGELAPGLATEWSSSDDQLTLTFTLRDGVKWHNGDPFTAADVKATLDRILDENTSAVGRSNLATITSVDAPDDTTAVLHLAKPSTAILYALASTNASIVHAADIAADTIGKDPNGTGPFAWKSWDQGQQIVLTGNADYWGGAPAIKELQFRVIPTESSILSGMRAGTFQLGLISDPSVAGQAGSETDFALTKQPSLSYHALMLNGRNGPLTDVRVRQAIACAVDRQEVIDTAAFGDGEVTGPITSPAFQYDATKGLPCEPGDVDAAKALMAEAGYAGGITIRTIVETGEYATSVAEGQNLQSQLAEIGVTLDLQQLATDPYVTAWLAADYDAAVALNGGSSDPYLMYGRYFTDGGSLIKPAGLAAPELNTLLTEGNQSTDEDARTATYQKLQEKLLELSPWVWLFRGDDYYLVGNDVEGFGARPDGSLISLSGTKIGG